MLRWFSDLLARLVQLGIDLMGALIAGVFGGLVRGGARVVAPIVVRPAGPDEVLDVRHAVLREGRPRHTAVFEGDAEPTTRHWIAVQADRVVGTVTVLQAPLPGSEAMADAPMHQLRGMAVLPELQGAGVGQQLLQAVHALGVPLWCNARAGVVGFYARQGWQPHGDVFDIPPIGPHQRMWWRPNG